MKCILYKIFDKFNLIGIKYTSFSIENVFNFTGIKYYEKIEGIKALILKSQH